MNKSAHTLYLTLALIVVAFSSSSVASSETVSLNKIGLRLINVYHTYITEFVNTDFSPDFKKEFSISSNTQLVMLGKLPSPIKAALYGARLAHVESIATFLLTANQGLKLYKLCNTDAPQQIIEQ